MLWARASVTQTGRSRVTAAIEGSCWPHSPHPQTPGRSRGQPFISGFFSTRDSVD